MNSDKNPVCMACKPMFFPSLSNLNLSGTDLKYIESCTLIANCSFSETFNMCETCNTGFVLLYEAGNVNLS